MMQDTIKTGDVVQLKSGGPVMTVEAVRGNTVDVIWGDGGIFQRASLLLATLDKTSNVPFYGRSK